MGRQFFVLRFCSHRVRGKRLQTNELQKFNLNFFLHKYFGKNADVTPAGDLDVFSNLKSM